MINSEDGEVHPLMVGEMATKATPEIGQHSSELESPVTLALTSTRMMKKTGNG